MNSEMRARDLMSTDFESLPPEATLKEAALKLKRAQEDRPAVMPEALVLLVVDGGELAGSVSMFSILKAVTPEYMQESPHLGGATWEGLFSECVMQQADMPVRDVMKTEVVSVPDDARLVSVMLAMVTGHILSVPVVDKEKQVVGVVRLSDVFREVVRRYEQEQ